MTTKNVEEMADVRAAITERTMVLSVTDTAARFIVPTAFVGKVVRARMVGSKADIVFGGASVACVYGQASSVSTEAVTVHASSGEHLPDGELVSFRMPTADVAGYFSVDCVTSGSGKLYITRDLA